MYPYLIRIKNKTALYKLKDGRYQTIKKGDIYPIMVGYLYVLVENKIAEYFQSLDIERVTFKPAIIWERSADIEYSNYQEMILDHHFYSSQINDIDLDGMQFLLMDNQWLFVTPKLKSVLSSSGLKLEFSEGLNGFAQEI
jgi:hypothetical protein